ncbi:hypothetical protein D3C87_1518960 [compost metagenome]
MVCFRPFFQIAAHLVEGLFACRFHCQVIHFTRVILQVKQLFPDLALIINNVFEILSDDSPSANAQQFLVIRKICFYHQGIP